MASVVQGTSDGNYDLVRGLRLYDANGDLPERARQLWAHIHDEGIEMAREFWRRYARSPELREPIDDAKVEKLAPGLVPYITNKFERIDDLEWTRQSRSYVERALGSGLTRSTRERPLSGNLVPAAPSNSPTPHSRASEKPEIPP